MGLTAHVVCYALIGLVAGQEVPLTNVFDRDVELEALATARSRYHTFRQENLDYHFNIRHSGLCNISTTNEMVHHVNVRNGDVWLIRALDDSSVEVEGDLAKKLTFESLFTYVQYILAQVGDEGNDVFDVTYHPTAGYPTSLFYDPAEESGKKELAFEISAWEPKGHGPDQGGKPSDPHAFSSGTVHAVLSHLELYEANKAKWERSGLSQGNYHFDLYQKGFLCLTSGDMHVEVLDGKVGAVSDIHGGTVKPFNHKTKKLTVDKLFKKLGYLVGGGASEGQSLTVEYDPVLGYPSSVDFSRDGAEGKVGAQHRNRRDRGHSPKEFKVVVTNLTPLPPGSAVYQEASASTDAYQAGRRCRKWLPVIAASLLCLLLSVVVAVCVCCAIRRSRRKNVGLVPPVVGTVLPKDIETAVVTGKTVKQDGTDSETSGNRDNDSSVGEPEASTPVPPEEIGTGHPIEQA